ncbi:DUF7507 domain-containing protein [Actinomadura oligospora]|uniref:DUF7507 domain-containing protein n=1 Tax=Actinomadura oligospora TaxID=111804 RepID=UPI0004BB1AE8|nr:DUF11 domain-containing protein [Actinomadura oligospora]
MGGPRRGGAFRGLGRTRAFTAAVVCGAMLAASFAPMPAAQARSEAAARGRAAAVPTTTPGLPGAPQPFTTVFGEDFQNRQSTLPVRLNNYTGIFGMTYTADQAWLQNCNGWVARYQDPAGGNASVQPQVNDCAPQGGPGATGANAWNHVRELSRALGVLNGTSPAAANLAVSAYTNGHINNGDPGANKVEFQTGQEIPLPQNGRFLTFSVNAAETSCDTNHNHALLDFYLYHGTRETPVTSQSVNPCTRGTQIQPGFWAGTFPGDAPILYTDPSVGIMMRNAQGSGNGNDHAFDDVRLLDVSPQLDKSFSPTQVEVGQTSTMRITITNTDDLLAKNGWSFTDTLPAGLRLASPANASTTCPAGTLTAPDGGTQVSMDDGSLNAGQQSCTVTVSVTSDTAGTYTNDASNITDSVGLNPPGESTVTFNEVPFASIYMTKDADRSFYSAADQTIHYTYTVTNTGSEPLTDVHVVDNLPGLSPVVCDETDLLPGASTDCYATYVTTQADVNAGYLPNTALATGTPPDGPDVTDDANLTIPAAVTTGLTLDKSADESSYSAAGQTITYRYHVVNDGNVTLNNVTVSDARIGQYAIPCIPSTLSPGEAADCTATYTTTQADVDAGSITNVAVARGTPPGTSEPTVSDPDDVTVPAAPGPAISVDKSADRSSFSAAGETITYTYEVTNTGNLTLEDVGVADDLPGLSEVTCEATTLDPGESATCTATYTTTEQDVAAGAVHNVATSHGTPPGATEPVESEPSDVTVRSNAKASIKVHKVVHPKNFTHVGQVLHYTYRVTNTGDVTLNAVRIDDNLRGLSAIRCPKRTLEPGESMTCTATYRVRARDLRARVVRNRAVAQGTPPGSHTPVRSRSSSAVSYGHVPVTG